MDIVYTSQPETLPGKRDNFSHMNGAKLFGESKYFLANRGNFFPYERALNLPVMSQNIEFILSPHIVKADTILDAPLLMFMHKVNFKELPASKTTCFETLIIETNDFLLQKRKTY